MVKKFNEIIHDYFGIDFDIIWDLIKTKIPLLKIEKIIYGLRIGVVFLDDLFC
ncbi:HepT-like ribonuclease domain-containing protein [Cyclobacterium jeungdonense]|uniref:HepT-like ribonuclease domain-containing protein n=1 Tax=Cyclobacterium jeungdonense TaxID=708087 RepID=UPI0013D1C215